MRSSELAAAWLEMCRTGDETRFGDLATDDYVAHGSGAMGNRSTFLDWLRWYPVAFADQKPVLEDVICSGDRLVLRYTVTSTYRGGYLDLPADGQAVLETGIIIFRMVDGRVAESWFESNDLEVAQQIGGRVTQAAPERR